MTAVLAQRHPADRPTRNALSPDGLARDAAIRAAAASACGRVAPLWPLKTFVAVNPFLGFTDRAFDETCADFRRVAGAEMLMPRAFYREALASGRIDAVDLAAALAAAPAAWSEVSSVEELMHALEDPRPARPAPRAVATVADVLDQLAMGDRQASRTAFMIDEISRWCAAFFDEGQAVWRAPSRTLGLYAGWKAAARHDLNPEVMGVKGFRATVAAAPDDPEDAIVQVVEALGLPARAVDDYLQRALFDIRGWAAFARQKVWTSALHGRADATLLELLAVRVVWGHALFQERSDPVFRSAWREAMQAAEALPLSDAFQDDPDVGLDLILHSAYEHAYQRRLLAALPGVSPPATARSRPAVQAAFCIDVRSEVYRRALEAVRLDAETIGFAGFFGFPIEYVPIGREHGDAQCPVLLTPTVVVQEGVGEASPDKADRLLRLRRLRRRAFKAWKGFKLSAISSFSFVETAGLLFGPKLLSDGLGLTRPAADPNTDGLSKATAARLGPQIAPGELGGRATGFDPAGRVDMAEAVLRGMSLTRNFARLVLLAGHGSTTVNNPHASGLDCGACGGHTGEANARVAAAILNDPAVRDGLRPRGIEIPEDTWFLGGLHDTTTDDVRLCDLDHLPSALRSDLVALRASLAEASARARVQRAPRLGLAESRQPEAAIRVRSRDWSQVRPEWGLAGAAAFIAAPRSFTAPVDLQGRAFLHSYDWRSDPEWKVLELILTAPMVVASWISLQYYGSTVNNAAFGSGDKTLHNVSGLVGVLEGNAGDLRSGLPMQSLHDGFRYVHEPVRLHVLVAAPVPTIDKVIAANSSVADLIKNSWVHLFALSDLGRVTHRYQSDFAWEKIA